MTPNKECEHCLGTGLERNQQTLGQTFRRSREGKGKTQRQMAKRLGVSTSFVSLLEAGKAKWTGTRVKQWMAVK
jgi:predicted transcriptional regulator